MLVAENLTRKYGDFTAVSDVSFEIGAGEIVGLLGHNGAGKTTVMKMLTGYLEPTAGRVRVDGVDIEDDLDGVQATIGYLPENCPVYPEMTVLDYLDFAAELRRVSAERRPAAIRAAIEATDLFEKAASPIADLSRGLRQRVGVAQAIIHEPKIVILDEPTNGLDPSQIRQMRALIKRLAENATVILSTHILQEVQAVCERAIIINRGRLAHDSRLADIDAGGRLRLVSNLDAAAARAATPSGYGLSPAADGAANGAHAYDVAVNGADLGAAATETARAIIEKGGEVRAIYPIARDLETLFAEVSSGKLDNEAASHA